MGTSHLFLSSQTVRFLFNPKGEEQVGKEHSAKIEIRVSGNILLGSIPLKGTAIAQRLDDDFIGPRKPTPIISLVEKSRPNVLASEFKLGTAGTPVKKEFVLQNLGDGDLPIYAIFSTGSPNFKTSLPNVNGLVLAPNQKLPITIEYLGGSTERESRELVIRADVKAGLPDYRVQLWVDKLGSSGSGESSAPDIVSGKPLDYGRDFVAISFPTNSALPAIRQISNEHGDFEAFLPPNEPIQFTVFDPVSGLIAHSYSTTSDSGVPTPLLTPYFDRSRAKDTDSDGIPDDIENAIGTSLLSPDSNGDGISDLAAIQQGLDPLAGRPVVTGIIANLPLQGEAKQVVVVSKIDDIGDQAAYVATGSYGLAIADVSQFNSPTLMGQIDLPGDAVDVAVDGANRLAAVANGSSLSIVDVANPQLPVMTTSIPINATQVEVRDGIIYVAVSGTLRSYAIRSGAFIHDLSLGGANITGLALEGSMLYSMDANGTLRAIDVSRPDMVSMGSLAMPQGSLAMPQGGGGLFVGNGIAYIPALRSRLGGYATVDVRNPNNLSLMANSAATQASASPNPYLVTNGSGLGVMAVGGDQIIPPSINVYDVRDNTKTDQFVTSFPLQTPPTSVTISGGIAYVANGSGGLQIVNYRAFDNRGIAPTITISTDASSIDIAPTEIGIQVLEGFSVPISSQIDDDVQVRSVELLVNGNLVSSSLSFPFNLPSLAPLLPDGETAKEFTVQVRATDTGGNSTLSNAIRLQVRLDTTPPNISLFNIAIKDVDATKPGVQSLEVQPLSVRFEANDIGGISRVELLQNGQVTETQTSRFGVFGLKTPILNNGETSRSITHQIRVTDVAGNSITSSEIQYELVPDLIAPRIASMNLRNGDVKSVGVYWLNIEFDKDIVPTSLTSSTFKLVDPNGQTISADRIRVLTPRSAQVQFTLPIAGFYDLTIESALIKDRSGNRLGDSSLVYRFEATNNEILFPRTQIPTGVSPQTLFSVDIDGDGKLDLVTSNVDPNVSKILYRPSLEMGMVHLRLH